MKKIHIIGIVIIAASVGVILSTISDSSTYTDFEKASENPGLEYQVVGKLNLENEMSYNPEENPYFTFYMIDSEGKEEMVKFKGSKPQDFERSDQVVITGQYINGEFIASKILMKCPSKYNDGGNVESHAPTESPANI